MAQEKVILRFDNVNFGYSENHLQLKESSFSVREKAKITLMGQNGAGKSTLFKLILGAAGDSSEIALQPDEGKVHLTDSASVAISLQVMPEEMQSKTVRDFFAAAFEEIPYNLDKQITDTLKAINYEMPIDRSIKDLSGGQQARLLLAYALIQKPDVLLLDEPTNNLDPDGIGQLIYFLMMYEKTVIVISHDADFLNSFTEGVLYLDKNTQKVEQYKGNYSDVVEEIKARIEREQRKNAQALKNIQDRKDKMNFFSHKGGKMRKLASKMREEVAEEEANMVDVRQEDRPIHGFTIPAQHLPEVIVEIKKINVMKNYEPISADVDISLRKGKKLIIKGPNGIGKSTLLRRLASGEYEGATINPNAKVGYYRQDFSGLDFSKTGYQALASVMGVPIKEDIFRTASRFHLSGSILATPVGAMSEGQKGLLCYAQFVLQEPALLIMDEPTNHINFRHLPVIAEALNAFEGTVMLVSHHEEFVDQLKIDEELDLARFLK
jgi:ATPase subunit of ABC transporter with duplicated ATPase domains